MKTAINGLKLLTVFTLLIAFSTNAQTSNTSSNKKTHTTMKTYLIERTIPDAGKLTAEQLKEIAVKSCGVLKEMGPSIEWVHSYVVGQRIYCVYKAENEELVKEHARRGGFPCDNIQEVANIISPATAEL